MPIVENDKAKIMWDIEFHLERAPENGANKIDMSVQDKSKKQWLLLEGTVCSVGKIMDRSNLKQEKYRELRSGIQQLYPSHKVTQVNLVFDFLGNYHKTLKSQVQDHITASKKETSYLLLKSQKWIMSQNCEIVKTFYQCVS